MHEKEPLELSTAIAQLVKYNWHDEQKNYCESLESRQPMAQVKQDRHIFIELEFINRALDLGLDNTPAVEARSIAHV